MNLALFVTKDNIERVAALVPEMAARQHEKVNGCLSIVHDSSIPKTSISKTVSALLPLFKASTTLPCQLNAGQALQARVASMFGRFLIGAYSRFPGPWMLMDEPAIPSTDNFMQAALRQHGAYGGKMTGRAIVNPGSVMPVGPVTFELPQKSLRFLRFGTGESWRSRGRYHFARSGFGIVPEQESLFQLPGVEAVEPKFDSAIITQTRGPESFTDAELRDLLFKITGTRPHHFTGREKLLAMLEETSVPS